MWSNFDIADVLSVCQEVMYDIRHRNVYSAVPGHALNFLRGPLRHKENLVLVAREIITFLR